MKKKFAVIITVAVLMAILCGCGNKQSKPDTSVPAEDVQEEAAVPVSESEETPAPSEEAKEPSEPSEAPKSDDSASAAPEEDPKTGPKTDDGWVLNDGETVGSVPEEAQAAFEKGTEAFVGQDLEIIAYLGSQIVSGTNHMFLCRGTMVTEKPVIGLKVVIVCEDPEGNAEISKVTDFNLGEYVMVDNQDEEIEQLAGGWTVYTDAPAVNLPAPAAALYDAVTAELLGAEYTPLAYLGSHKDGTSGASNAFLARQALVTREPVDNMCLIYIYDWGSKDPELMNIFTLNLADFN